MTVSFITQRKPFQRNLILPCDTRISDNTGGLLLKDQSPNMDP